MRSALIIWFASSLAACAPLPAQASSTQVYAFVSQNASDQLRIEEPNQTVDGHWAYVAPFKPTSEELKRYEDRGGATRYCYDASFRCISLSGTIFSIPKVEDRDKWQVQGTQFERLGVIDTASGPVVLVAARNNETSELNSAYYYSYSRNKGILSISYSGSESGIPATTYFLNGLKGPLAED